MNDDLIPVAEVDLQYGKSLIPFAFDESFELLVPPEASPPLAPLTDPEIDLALDVPIDSPPLEDIISPQETVLIVVSDATRPTASDQVVNILVRRLVQLSISPANISIIFSTGIHRRVTDEEKRQLLTPFITQRIRTIDHDPHDRSNLIELGTTETGTPIEVSRTLEEFSHVILTGAIDFHYFAGFTGGRKSICPGLASAQTIAATHALTLDEKRGVRRAGVGVGRLDGNPVHEECERVAAQVAPSFLINTIADERGRAIRVYAGHWRTAHRYGCAELATERTLQIGEKRPLVIASCGGWPKDINLIQAHKTLDTAALACTDGGTIVLLAECADGLGRPDFLKWFTGEGSEALAQRLRDAYEVNGQTAWALLTKTERYRVLLVSKLLPQDVRLMGMEPVASLEEALSQTQATPGYILPHGASYLPVVVT
ncbi:MAG: nickel-dependent lactate racemase [Pyrinomonadaceae bacterium]